MAQQTDLYSILTSFAKKTGSPHIDLAAFSTTLEKHAKRMAESDPDWSQWAADTSAKIWAELPHLVAAKRCLLETAGEETRIFMHNFHVDLVEKAYLSMDEDADRLFPNEESMGLTLSRDHLRPISLEADFAAYLGSPQESQLPVLKLVFPDGEGSALVIPSMIPRQLIHAALLKIRYYLRSHHNSNRDYLQHKLGAHFPGRESHLQDMLNQVIVRPLDCAAAIQRSGDFIYYFWAYLCSAVKADIKRKKERLPEESAALQAAYLLEVFNSYYKGLAVKQRDKEIAFKELDLKMDQAPYLFTVDVISTLSDSKGIPLLGQFSREELENYLRAKATGHKENTLPELLIIRGPSEEQWFIKKNKLLPLCAKLLADARPKIKKAVSKRWVKVLEGYGREAAMDNDRDFEKLLAHQVSAEAPALKALLEDKKLSIVYAELERVQAIRESSRLFNKGALVPLSVLLMMKRRDLLTDAKILLPFWYHIPLVTVIMAFFKKVKRKKQKKEEGEGAAGEENKTAGEEDKTAGEDRAAASLLAESYVPQGYTLDSYLAEIASRWSRRLNKRDQQNLIEDVNSLIRDRLRFVLRLQNRGKISANFVNTLAAKIQETPSLSQISEKETLSIYIQIYIIKLLMNRRGD